MRDRKLSEDKPGSESNIVEDLVEELYLRREAALEMGGPEAIERQHKAGRLTIRERISKLTDDGSFREIGTLAGSAEYDDKQALVSVKPAIMYILSVSIVP